MLSSIAPLPACSLVGIKSHDNVPFGGINTFVLLLSGDSLSAIANKFSLDDLISNCSYPEDSNDSEDDTGTAFDKKGDKRCHIFSYSSPGPPEDVPSMYLLSLKQTGITVPKKQRMDRHSKVQKTNDACERTTPTKLPKHVHRSVKSSTLSKK